MATRALTRDTRRVLLTPSGALWLHDTFGGTGTLDAHAPAPVNRVGAVWGANYASLFDLVGGQAVYDGDNYAWALANRLGNAARYITEAATIDLGGAPGLRNPELAILLRSDTANRSGNYWLVSCYIEEDEVRILETGVLRASVAHTFDYDTYYKLDVRDDGVTITVYIDDENVLSYTSSTYYGSEYAGLQCRTAGGVTEARFRYFKVS